MDELRDQPTRRRLLDAVKCHPGSSARDLQRELGLGWGETIYHLGRLTRGGALRRERGGRRDFYFVEEVSWNDRKLLQTLRSASERRLVVLLAHEPGLTFNDLHERSGLGKSTVSYHVGHLVARGEVDRFFFEGVHRYRLTRPERVSELLRQFHETFGDRLVDRFVASFTGILREPTQESRGIP